jgi:multiple antibiotic resistance protein
MSAVASITISLLVALVVYLTFSRSALFSSYLGREGTTVARRVSAFLLLCVGVQIMLTGFSEFLTPIAAAR